MMYAFVSNTIYMGHLVYVYYEIRCDAAVAY